MKILFLHGWQSTPGGVKPTYLKEHGHEVLNPALPDEDFDEAVRIAQAQFDQHHPEVVVGSSRGGAVGMNINCGNTPLVLICPAWKHWGTAKIVNSGTVILHSRADDVVPFSESVELFRNSSLPVGALIEVGTDHRLADPESLAKMLEGVEKAGKNRQINRRVKRQEAGVPHRFGIGTLLVITAIFAILFAFLHAVGCNPVGFCLIALLFAAVMLGQMLLFKGKEPRLASIIVGACFYPVEFFGTYIYEALASGQQNRFAPDVFVAFFYCILAGAILGYFAGLFVASVFLLTDGVRSLRGRFRGLNNRKTQDPD